MTLRLQRVRSTATWDRPRAVHAGHYWILAMIVRHWSYEAWLVQGVQK